MNVLFVTNGYPTQNSPNLCPFIHSQVLDLKAIGLNVEVISVSQFQKFGYFKTFIRSLFLIKNYNVVHFHHGLTLLLCFSFCFLYPKKKFVISFLNNIEVEYEELNSKFLQSFLVKLTKLVIKITNITVIEKNSRFSRNFKSYYVLPNGVDLDFYVRKDKSLARAKLRLADNDFVFLFISSKTLYRNQKRIDRFHEIISSNPQITPLYMSGVDKIETIDYYSAADFLVITSELEGSPNAVKESIACGTPVLSLDVGDVKNILNGEENSKVFNSFDEMKNYVKDNNVNLLKRKFFDGHKLIIKNGYDSHDIASQLRVIYTN